MNQQPPIDHLERSMVTVMTHGPQCTHLTLAQRQRIAKQAVAFVGTAVIEQLYSPDVTIRQHVYTLCYQRCVALSASILRISDSPTGPIDFGLNALNMDMDMDTTDTLVNTTTILPIKSSVSVSMPSVPDKSNDVTIRANTLLNGRQYDYVAATATATGNSYSNNADNSKNVTWA
jgi:hypothetical protein